MAAPPERPSEKMAMDLTAHTIGRLLWATVMSPAETARFVLGRGLSRDVLWTALALATILSVLATALVQLVVPIPDGQIEAAIPMAPMLYGMILGCALVVTVFALHFTGQALGGDGEFSDSLATVVWIQFLLVALQLAQGALMWLSAGLGALASYATLFIVLWTLANFVNVMHHFGSLARAALTIILAFLGAGIGISLILTLIGVGTGGGAL